jgi:FMN phosphatase YigB (HAD superfamily)
MRTRLQPFKLLICDLDNTLYDWVAYFVPAFYAMLDKAVEVLGCDREKLLDDFREVHQRYHDSEHPFALLETATINERFKGRERHEIAEMLDAAFHAFNAMRKRYLKLHPGVKETLECIRGRGIRVVAHTDSQLFGVVDRLTRLHLTDYFSNIYCRERPQLGHPDPDIGERWLDNFPMQKVRELSKRQMKPDPKVLTEICNTEGVTCPEAAYIGDSIARDILMAKKAGVFGIWAKYGATLDSDEYAKLVRVTHWTKDDVEREKQLKKDAESIRPDFVAENSFAEILLAIFPYERLDIPPYVRKE